MGGEFKRKIYLNLIDHDKLTEEISYINNDKCIYNVGILVVRTFMVKIQEKMILLDKLFRA
ncbi:MAG: hypothetical protein PF693_03980 [Spirochaetia bacterium]|nr:hypothetical protein [Spirochaetia bacterium]